jgi:hypothetical protein
MFSFIIVLILLITLISFTTAEPYLRMKAEAMVLIQTPGNFGLRFNGTASGYVSNVAKSYHDGTITLQAALTDCFNTCTGK